MTNQRAWLGLGLGSALAALVTVGCKSECSENLAAPHQPRDRDGAPSQGPGRVAVRRVTCVLRVGEAFGYVDVMPTAVTQRMNRVIGTLVRVAA